MSGLTRFFFNISLKSYSKFFKILTKTANLIKLQSQIKKFNNINYNSNYNYHYHNYIIL